MKAAWHPILIAACENCNNGSSDDDAHLRHVLLASGATNELVLELWYGPVERGLAQVDGRRRALDVFKLMEPAPDAGDDRYRIFPARDERVLRSIRKITRGLCAHHGLGVTADERVTADVQRQKMPDELFNVMRFFEVGSELFDYGFVTLEKRSIWLLRFYERTMFVSAVDQP